MSECSVQALKWGATWPSREQFHELADQGYRVIPIVRRLLADSLTPVGFYERLAAGRSGTFILESAEFGGTWNQIQLHRCEFHGSVAFQQRQGRLVGSGSRRRAYRRRCDGSRAGCAENTESAACRGLPEPDQWSCRYRRLGCDSPLGKRPCVPMRPIDTGMHDCP